MYLLHLDQKGKMLDAKWNGILFSLWSKDATTVLSIYRVSYPVVRKPYQFNPITRVRAVRHGADGAGVL